MDLRSHHDALLLISILELSFHIWEIGLLTNSHRRTLQENGLTVKLYKILERKGLSKWKGRFSFFPSVGHSAQIGCVSHSLWIPTFFSNKMFISPRELRHKKYQKREMCWLQNFPKYLFPFLKGTFSCLGDWGMVGFLFSLLSLAFCCQ